MTAFKWVNRLRILLNLILAICLLWCPQIILNFLRIEIAETAKDFAAFAGVFYIFITSAYIPSAFAPLKTQVSNVFPLLAPIIPIILLFALGKHFIWIALYELVFAILLNFTHRRGWIEDLMKSP